MKVEPCLRWSGMPQGSCLQRVSDLWVDTWAFTLWDLFVSETPGIVDPKHAINKSSAEDVLLFLVVKITRQNIHKLSQCNNYVQILCFCWAFFNVVCLFILKRCSLIVEKDLKQISTVFYWKCLQELVIFCELLDICCPCLLPKKGCRCVCIVVPLWQDFPLGMAGTVCVWLQIVQRYTTSVMC